MVLAPGAPAGPEADPSRIAWPRSRRTSARRGGRTEIDRLSTDRAKTGVAIGADAINPVSGERIPIFVADYVLATYGTGAIMAVPAHDERDFEFAQAFGLEIRRVVAAPGRGRRRSDGCRLHRPCRGRGAGQQRAVLGAAGRRGRQGDRGLAGRDRTGRAQGHLPAARLAGQPAALLGHADPGHLLPDGRRRAGPGRRAAGAPAGDRRLRGQRRQPAQPRRGVPARRLPALRRPGPARDRHHGHLHGFVVVLVPLPVTGRAGRPGGSRDDRQLDAGRPVHRRRRARRHAPAVRPLLHQGDGRQRAGPRPRAVQAAVQPGPDPGRGRRADVEVAGQRPGSRRAGRALRRRHGPAVPDVHGAVGPGRAVEPDRDRRRPPLPQPGLDARRGPARSRAGRPGCRGPAGGRDRGDRP